MKRQTVPIHFTICLCFLFLISLSACKTKQYDLGKTDSLWELDIRLSPKANLVNIPQFFFIGLHNICYDQGRNVNEAVPLFVYWFEEKVQLDECRERLLGTGLVTGVRIIQLIKK